MTPELEAAKSSRIVIVSVVSAAVAITLLCIVGIAAILGLVGPRSEEPPAVAAVKLAQKTARTEPPAVALAPGETLVSPPDAPPAPTPGNTPAPAAAPESTSTMSRFGRVSNRVRLERMRGSSSTIRRRWRNSRPS